MWRSFNPCGDRCPSGRSAAEGSGTHNVADGIGDVAANVERIDGAIGVDPITILQDDAN